MKLSPIGTVVKLEEVKPIIMIIEKGAIKHVLNKGVF